MDAQLLFKCSKFAAIFWTRNVKAMDKDKKNQYHIYQQMALQLTQNVKYFYSLHLGEQG
jgi:hypothetical protein